MLLLTVAVVLPAWSAAEPQLSVSPRAGDAGTEVSGSGQGFAAGFPVQVRFGADERLVWSGISGPVDGAFTFSFVVPDLGPGRHRVVARQALEGQPTARTTFNILAPTTASGSGSAPAEGAEPPPGGSAPAEEAPPPAPAVAPAAPADDGPVRLPPSRGSTRGRTFDLTTAPAAIPAPIVAAPAAEPPDDTNSTLVTALDEVELASATEDPGIASSLQIAGLIFGLLVAAGAGRPRRMFGEGPGV